MVIEEKRVELLQKLVAAGTKMEAGGTGKSGRDDGRDLSRRVLFVLQEAIKPEAPPELIASAKRLAAIALAARSATSGEFSDLLRAVLKRQNELVGER